MFDIHTILPLVAFIVSLVLGHKVWRYRRTEVVQTFLIIMGALGLWSLSALVEYVVPDLGSKIFWIKVSYFGIAAIPVAWLIFTLQYTSRGNWLTRGRRAALIFIPACTILIAWTNDITHLMWSNIWLNASVTPPVDAVSHGAWFWIHAAYSYTLILAGTLVLFSSFRHASGMYKRQLYVMLLGTAAPWLANIVYLSFPRMVVDPTPLSFAVTGAAFFWGLSNFNLMDILPVTYDVIFNKMAEGVLVLDGKQRVIGLNNKAQEIVGRKRTDIVGRQYNAALPSLQGLEGLETKSVELMLPAGDSEKRFYEVSTSPIYHKRRFHGTLILLHDITKQKEAEAEARQRVVLETELRERQKREEVLRISEAKYRSLVVNAPVGIVTVTPEGKILNANKAVIDMFGFQSSVDVTRIDANLLYADPADRARLLSVVREHGFAANFISAKKRASGEIFWTSQNTIVQVAENGQVQFLTFLADDTERIKAADELAKLNEELTELNASLEGKVAERTKQLEQAVVAANASNQAKSDFLASMSHELRTPLNAILGFSQLLSKKYFGPLNEKQSEYVEDILGSGQHLLSLINDILDLAKIEAGKLELQVSPVRLPDLFASSLLMVKEKALKHGIQISTTCDSEVESLEYQLDERKIKQVMFNLLSNACKFTPDGGKIFIDASSNCGNLEISVTDTGIGIPKEYQENLFTEFFQVQGGLTSKTPGTGLGLAISKRIVELHSGEMRLESEGAGKGSRFIFSIPIINKGVESDKELTCSR